MRVGSVFAVIRRLLPGRHRNEGLLRYGLDARIQPIADLAIVDFVLRSVVHSALTVLAIYDVALHQFYRSQVAEMLSSLPVHLSWSNDISKHLNPYVSAQFQELVGTSRMEALIAAFARYYLTRLPILVWHASIRDIPAEIGFSEADCDRMVTDASLEIERLFPGAWRELHAGGPDDPTSIYQQVAAGKGVAKSTR